MSHALIGDRIRAWAQRSPERLAVVAGEQRLTCAELGARADELGGRLVAAGACDGERVLVIARNSAAYLVAALAAWRAGAILATAYPSGGADEHRYALRNAQPRLVLVDAERADVVRAAAAEVGARVELLDDEARVPGLTQASPLPAGPVDPGAPALVCYTSGTAAHPKPVTHSHQALADAAGIYGSVWHFGPDERVVVALPMAWLYGLLTTSLAMLAAGGGVVVLARFHPVALLDAIERERVTVLPGVTTIYGKLLSVMDAEPRERDLGALRLCISGGEPRNEPLFERWRVRVGVPVHDLYCASECFPIATYDPLRDPEPRPGAAGRLVEGASMRVLRPDGSEAAVGEVGEAYWRGAAFMLGYWREPELTAKAVTDDGWYRTGDLLRVDADGYLYVAGRATDMIIRGGSNISPAEVEAAIAEHDDVLEAAVVGLPDPEYGQTVAAAVLLRPGAQLDAEALRAHCRARLASFKVPSAVVALDELPRTATGKVTRRALAPLLRDALAAEGAR